MSKRVRRFFLIFGDIAALNIAAVLTFHYRFMSGNFANPVQLYWSDVPLPFLILTILWLGIFTFNGLYSFGSTVSRTDELLTIWKVAILGVLLLFLLTVDPTNPLSEGRMALILYGIFVGLFVALNHFMIHTIHRKRLEMGKGHQNTVIVGWNDVGHEYYHKTSNHPALGMDIRGFVTVNPDKYEDEELDGVRLLGGINDLGEIISQYEIQQIVIALESSDHDCLLDIIELTSGAAVSLKIIPDML